MGDLVPLSVRIKGFFARDKHAFWWSHFTDEEKQLRRMDVWELAKVINEARVRNLAGEAEKLIVAEHMLQERLARIQARPAYFAIYAGLAGVAGGVFLTSALQPPNETNKCVCESKTAGTLQQPAQEPVKVVPAKSPASHVVDIPSGNSKQTEQKHNAAANPYHGNRLGSTTADCGCAASCCCPVISTLNL